MGATPGPLECAEIAHLACRMAWMYPDDPEQRIAAIEASAACGIDYIEALAATIESTSAPDDVARRQVAESFRRAADRFYAADGGVL